MRRSLLIALAAVVGLALIVVAWWFLSRERVPSPEELAEIALTAESPQERERAAAQLIRHGDDAKDELRRVLAGSDTPEVRAICVQGLAALRDYDSMENMLDALEDPSAVVRSAAARAGMQLLGAKYEFDAEGPPEKRKKTVEFFRETWSEYKDADGFKAWMDQMQQER